MYRDLIDNMIEKYGCTWAIRYPSGNVVMKKAIITPMRYRYGSFAASYEVDGRYDDRSYLYIGKAELDLSKATGSIEIRGNKQGFILDHAEMYYFCGSPLYCRAVLRREGENMY